MTVGRLAWPWGLVGSRSRLPHRRPLVMACTSPRPLPPCPALPLPLPLVPQLALSEVDFDGLRLAQLVASCPSLEYVEAEPQHCRLPGVDATDLLSTREPHGPAQRLDEGLQHAVDEALVEAAARHEAPRLSPGAGAWAATPAFWARTCVRFEFSGGLGFDYCVPWAG